MDALGWTWPLCRAHLLPQWQLLFNYGRMSETQHSSYEVSLRDNDYNYSLSLLK